LPSRSRAKAGTQRMASHPTPWLLERAMASRSAGLPAASASPPDRDARSASSWCGPLDAPAASRRGLLFVSRSVAHFVPRSGRRSRRPASIRPTSAAGTCLPTVVVAVAPGRRQDQARRPTRPSLSRPRHGRVVRDPDRYSTVVPLAAADAFVALARRPVAPTALRGWKSIRAPGEGWAWPPHLGAGRNRTVRRAWPTGSRCSGVRAVRRSGRRRARGGSTAAHRVPRAAQTTGPSHARRGDPVAGRPPRSCTFEPALRPGTARSGRTVGVGGHHLATRDLRADHGRPVGVRADRSPAGRPARDPDGPQLSSRHVDACRPTYCRAGARTG
jgi:hypothetical protein